jgi:starvation-inducible DNA-binding protein
MKTHNGLDSNAKQASISLLNARLADSIDLALAVKQAHWNMKGQNFIAVHEMMDKLRADLDSAVDTVAERVAALGGVALGTSQTVAGGTRLPAYPTNISAVEDHLSALITRLAQAGDAVRENIDDADEAGDAATADIFTSISRDLDKWLWFLESHQPKASAGA